MARGLVFGLDTVDCINTTGNNIRVMSKPNHRPTCNNHESSGRTSPLLFSPKAKGPQLLVLSYCKLLFNAITQYNKQLETTTAAIQSKYDRIL